MLIPCDLAGLVDLGDSALIIRQGLSLSAVAAAVMQGRNGGTWDGTAGITSSSLPAANAGVGYYQDGDGETTMAVTILGDADVDGEVDYDDYVALVAAFGTTTGAYWQDCDTDYDGDTDVLDYVRLKQNWGQSYTGGAAGLVPEPATVALLAFGAAGLVVRRRRRK